LSAHLLGGLINHNTKAAEGARPLANGCDTSFLLAQNNNTFPPSIKRSAHGAIRFPSDASETTQSPIG
jgi:hypothetical protein